MLILALAFLIRAAAQLQPPGAPFKAPVTVAPGFTARVLFSNLTLPRGITFDAKGNLLVVERGVGVSAFTETGSGGWERKVVIPNVNFTQGIQADGTRLYVSTPGEALLYVYDPATKSVSGAPLTVVNGIPPDGDLTTHTLQLENTGHGTDLLIASGPFTNIDPTARDPSSGRSQIRRFIVPSSPSTPATPSHTGLPDPANPTAVEPQPIVPPVTSLGPRSFLSGELLAYGIRNPAGFAFSPTSPSSTLFAVENGASIDNVTGLTAAFVNDNPADELEAVDLAHTGSAAAFYGFPDCTTLWNPTADPVGDPQYVNLSRGDQISLLLEPGRDDAWCRENKNNKPPVLSFQAHSVPLDIKFYTPPSATAHPHAFPDSFSGDAFVSFHGSFNRAPPTGYGVVRVPFSGNHPTSQNYTFLVQATNLVSCPGACIRPVGLAFGGDGRLYASSDSSGELFVLEKTA